MEILKATWFSSTRRTCFRLPLLQFLFQPGSHSSFTSGESSKSDKLGFDSWLCPPRWVTLSTVHKVLTSENLRFLSCDTKIIIHWVVVKSK